LREHKILGAVTHDNGVIVPPLEYDPATGEEIQRLTEVGPAGTVESWTWVPEPTSKHPLQHPFAFALIKPDGADTAMVHVVDCPTEAQMEIGMRVHPRWKTDPTNMITDIEAWERV
jgi:uncharacterized OB-fold protein